MTTPTGEPRSRGAALGLGVLITLAGIVLLVWPGATTVVLVSWLGLAILVYGVYELITSRSPRSRSSHSPGSPACGC